MTTGNVLYLAMSIVTFVVFSLVLGYESWQQSRIAPKIEATPKPEPHGAVTA